MSMEQIDKIIDSCLKDFSGSFQTFLSDPENIEMEDVEEAARRDPVLAIKILKVANSPFYGLEREVYSIRDAILILGLQAVKNIVIYLKLRDGYLSGQLEASFINHVLDHSWKISIVVERIAKRKHISCNTVAVLGLLHDIGELILAVHLGEAYIDFKTNLDHKLDNQTQIEKQKFGLTHAEVGAYALRKWRLPEPIVEAVDRHHDCESMEELPFCQLCVMAELILSRSKNQNDWTDSDIEIAEMIGLQRDDMEELTQVVINL